MGSMASLDGCGEEKISNHQSGSNPESSSSHWVTIPTTLCRPLKILFWRCLRFYDVDFCDRAVGVSTCFVPGEPSEPVIDL